jgi:hypothetical protein
VVQFLGSSIIFVKEFVGPASALLFKLLAHKYAIVRIYAAVTLADVSREVLPLSPEHAQHITAALNDALFREHHPRVRRILRRCITNFRDAFAPFMDLAPWAADEPIKPQQRNHRRL